MTQTTRRPLASVRKSMSRAYFSSPERSSSRSGAKAKCRSRYKGLRRHHPRKGKPVVRLGRKTKGRDAAQFPEKLIKLHLDEIQLWVAVAWSPKGCWLLSEIVHLSTIGWRNARLISQTPRLLAGLHDGKCRPVRTSPPWGGRRIAVEKASYRERLRLPSLVG